MDGCTQSPSGELLQAFGEFNREDWFECHETLEDLWVGSEGELRDFYQGILQVAVALLHWRRGNYKGSVLLLVSGTDKLRRVRPVCQRIEVEALVVAADLFHESLAALDPERMAELDPALIPRLRLAPDDPVN
jgi:uncharacterized protein